MSDDDILKQYKALQAEKDAVSKKKQLEQISMAGDFVPGKKVIGGAKKGFELATGVGDLMEPTKEDADDDLLTAYLKARASIASEFVPFYSSWSDIKEADKKLDTINSQMKELYEKASEEQRAKIDSILMGEEAKEEGPSE